jgi:methylmalonyl-CoA/ethylmalonyl-CoA epimerase
MTNNTARLNHLAVAVPDLDAALTFYRDALGLHLERIEDVEREAVKVAFLPLGDGPGQGEIELVQPTRDDTGIAKWLSKHGAGMHHLCIQVDDIAATMERLRAHQIELINPEPVQKADGTRYAFVHPKSAFGVLVELYELRS